MTTTYRTKLFRSILDCGCSMGLGEFSEEARLEDVEDWVAERGYVLMRFDGDKTGDPGKRTAGSTR